MALNNFTFAEICQMIIVPAFFDTLKMLLISGVLSTFLGFFVGVILIITEKGGLCENVIINRILDFIVNTVRSFPFIILMVSIIPFTRLVVGTSIGDTAALVPLTVAEMLIAACVMVPYVLLTGGRVGFPADTEGTLWLIFLCLVNTGLACLMYFTSMNRLPARAVALFGYVDPVSALIFSAVFLHESMGPVQILGAALVFAGAAWGQSKPGERL